MTRRKRFWLGLLLLLLAPLAVLAAFAAYVYAANAQPQSGDLQTRVSPQVVMPWGEAVYYLDYAGFKPTPTPPPVPTPTPAPTPTPSALIDMVFVVDESSSMTSSIGTMAAAAQSVVQDLARERRGRIRYTAIRFDETAQVETDWTDNPDQLSQGLGAIAQTAQGRGTNGFIAFAKLGEVLTSARPGSQKVVIFYTDGEMYGDPASGDALKEMARKMRDGQGVEFYSVGVPYKGSDPLMIEVTGDPDRVFDPLNPAELARMFQELKVAVAQSTGSGTTVGPVTRTPRDSSGQLSHRLDGRHFSVPLADTNWMLSSGAINLSIRPVPDAPTTYAHPLVPLSAGLWEVGVEPPRMVIVDKAGQQHQVDAVRRPLLLKVTYLTLLLMALPAMLWALAHLVLPKPKPDHVVEPKGIELPPLQSPTLPEPLPLLPRSTLEQLPPVPTLFIGLGGAGRRALNAVRADLKQAHLGSSREPYGFLWVDTDTQEAERGLPFEDWEDYPIEELIAPPAVRQTESYLPDHSDAPDHMRWFNPLPYRDAPRALLNLADGGKGERPLARLVLFRWLSAQDGILARLVERFNELAAHPAADGARQVVIFASSDGGVGSGWFLDFGRLLQRIAHQRQGQEALPDVIGVLCDESERRHPENRQALMMELETALSARKFPQRVTYAPGEALLDQVEAQAPYHYVFSVTAGDKSSLAAQCGELASVLVERHPRAGLLDQSQTVATQAAVTASTTSAHVLPTLLYDQVRCELFLRLLGPDVLLDIAQDSQGGLRPQPVAADRAADLLDDWGRGESTARPLQLLLRAATDTAASSAFAELMRGASDAPREWFGESFATAVSERLRGHAALSSGWERGWRPGEAVATLRLLAARLESNVKPALAGAGAGTQALEVVDHVTALAGSAADDLERWVQDFCREFEQVAGQLARLDQARRQLLRLQGRQYLDLEVEPAQIQNWSRASLESWLGTPDTISAIRQRLFFEVSADGARANVAVRSFIARDSRSFAAADEVADEINHLARTLALQVPAVRISGVLSGLPAERQRDIARELVRGDRQPRQVLLVLPRTTGLGREEQEAIEEFAKAVPNPATHGPRAQQAGDDHSAIRRLELAEVAVAEADPAGRPLNFVEMAESVSEAVRRRAEKKHQIALPVFPSRLRIALTHPSAFRSFARAYKAGQIVLRQDDNGREQWSVADTGQFLTFGGESSLAHAAANYARDVKTHPDSFTAVSPGGSFDKLAQWRDERVAPDHDTLTQIAVDVYE